MSHSIQMRGALLLLAAFLIPASARVSAQDLSKAVQARLIGKLNTKSAKVGDTIAAETTAGSKLGDGTDLPKGSKIIGTVTAVQSQKAGGSPLLSIKFDRVEVKGGGPLTVAAVLVAVAPPPMSNGNADFNGTPGHGMGSGGVKTGLNHDDQDKDAPIPLGSGLENVTFDQNEGADGLSTLHSSKKDINLEKDGLVRIYFPN